MSDGIRVAAIDDVEPGEALVLDTAVTATAEPISLFRDDDGTYYALDDTCSHQQASLSDGWIEDCHVECPLHSSRFDLRTGIPDVAPARKPVRSHAVRVQDGTIYVLESDAEPNLPPMGRR